MGDETGRTAPDLRERRPSSRVAVIAVVAVVALLAGGWAAFELLREDAGEPPGAVDGEGAPPPDRSQERLNALDVPGVDCDGRGADDLQVAVEQATEAGRILQIPATGASCLLAEPLWTLDGARIEAEPDAVVQALPGFKFDAGDSLVNVVNVNDVAISGGTWRMLEEGRDVFRIMSSTGVTLTDLTAVGGGNDGVYIGRSGPSTQPPSDEHPTPEDVTLERVMAEGNLRLGFAIISGRRISVLDAKAHNNGVPPGSHDPRRGMQIEPNIPEDVLEAIEVVNLETRGNAHGGALVALDKLTHDSADVDIVFEGFDSEGEEYGFGVAHGASRSAPAGVGGTIRVVDPRIHRAATHGLFVTNNWVTATQVEIVRPVITEWNTTPTREEWTDAAIIVSAINDTPSAIGNVRIVEPTITASPQASRFAYYLRARNERHGGVENVEFLDPVQLEGGRGFDVTDGVVVDEPVD